MDKTNRVPLPPLPSAEELFSPASAPPLPSFDPIEMYCTILPPSAPPNEVPASKLLTSPQRPEVISPLSPVSKPVFFKDSWNQCVAPSQSTSKTSKRTANTDTDSTLLPAIKKAKYVAVEGDVTCPIVLSPSDNAADDSVEEGEITSDSEDDCKVSYTQSKMTTFDSKTENECLNKVKDKVGGASAKLTNGKASSHPSSGNSESTRRSTCIQSESKTDKPTGSRYHGSGKHASAKRLADGGSHSRDGHHSACRAERSSNDLSNERRSSERKSIEQRPSERSNERRSSDRRSIERRSSERRSSERRSNEHTSSRSYDRSKYAIVKSKYPYERSSYRSERSSSGTSSLDTSEPIKESSHHHHRSIYDFAKQPNSINKSIVCNDSKISSATKGLSSGVSKANTSHPPTSDKSPEGGLLDIPLPGYSKVIADPRRKPIESTKNTSQVPCSSTSYLGDTSSSCAIISSSCNLNNSKALTFNSVVEPVGATGFTDIASYVPINADTLDVQNSYTFDTKLALNVDASDLQNFSTFVINQTSHIKKVVEAIEPFGEQPVNTSTSFTASSIPADGIQDQDMDFPISEVLNISSGLQANDTNDTKLVSAAQILLPPVVTELTDSSLHESLNAFESYASFSSYLDSLDTVCLGSIESSDCSIYQKTQAEDGASDCRNWYGDSELSRPMTAENNVEIMVDSSYEKNVQAFVESTQESGIQNIFEAPKIETREVDEAHNLIPLTTAASDVSELNALSNIESSNSFKPSAADIRYHTEDEKLTPVSNAEVDLNEAQPTIENNYDDAMGVSGFGHEFNIIDDLGSDLDEMNELEVSVNSSDAESVGEIAPLQEDPVAVVKPQRERFVHQRNRTEDRQPRPYIQPEDGEGFEGPLCNPKSILIEKGQNPFDILPEGWVVVTHKSGMPIYLHKHLRVCSVSRPYFLGPGSVRKHNIPVSSIPCLQYRRALEKENELAATEANILAGDSGSVTSLAVIDQSQESSTLESTMNVNMQSDIAAGDVVKLPESEGPAANPLAFVVDCPASMLKSLKATKLQTIEDHELKNCLKPDEFLDYCSKLFQFKTITVRRFRRWKDRRSHNVMLKKANRSTLLPSSKLITCPSPTVKDPLNTKRKKEFVLNPAGKSHICVLHEYAQHALHIQPRYTFQELENADTPYKATVIINDVQYGSGMAASKKAAKLEAARITLGILIPDMSKELNTTHLDLHHLSFFDDIKIEDPRISDLCIKAGQPTPFQVLGSCLKRNFGMGDTEIQMETQPLKHQRSDFTMKVGKHEAKVRCKNKREGKQLAAQAILKLMHPQLTMWGSLLRLYAKSSEIKERKEEEHSVTELQTKAEPNKAILSKLRMEMEKLYHIRNAMKVTVKGTLTCQGPNVSSTELGGVNL